MISLMPMEDRLRFIVHRNILELHSKTVLQHSPKPLKEMGICFKFFQIKWLHTACTAQSVFFKYPKVLLKVKICVKKVLLYN